MIDRDAAAGLVAIPVAARPDPVDPAAPGTVIASGYRVIEHLSRGHRLDVYDAWSDERDSRCVLKTLRPDRAGEASARRSLELEGRLLRRLTHPHLVRAYATVRTPDGRPVVVLETLPGETLAHLLGRLTAAGTRLAPVDVALLGRQLCSVVGYLHRHGLLHRDIKPANIVANAGRATLIDLSLVRRPGRAPAGAGTFAYLAPEQARGGVLGPAVDAWGIGAVLFAALAGAPPFGEGVSSTSDEDEGPSTGPAGTTPADAATAPEHWPQLDGRAPRLVDLTHLSPELAAIVDACLDPDPDRRPAIADLAESLAAWLEQQGVAS
jgi:serine/threonine protein kinase